MERELTENETRIHKSYRSDDISTYSKQMRFKNAKIIWNVTEHTFISIAVVIQFWIAWPSFITEICFIISFKYVRFCFSVFCIKSINCIIQLYASDIIFWDKLPNMWARFKTNWRILCILIYSKVRF